MRTLLAGLVLVSLPVLGDDGTPMAVASAQDGTSITLYTGPGPCLGNARLATWRPKPGSSAPAVRGCWVLTNGVVYVSYLDGDRSDIPVGLLVKTVAL